MTRTKTLENAFLTFLLAAFLSFALLIVASPASAAPRDGAVNERIAQLCTVSDTDLVGKRLAKECRKQVRADQVARQKERIAQQPRNLAKSAMAK